MEKKMYIEAGKIINTHGINGEVKIEVWLDSPEFFRRFKRIYIDGSEIKLLSAKAHKGFILAKLEGVDNINAAMALKEKEISVLRDDAQLPDGICFISELIGATVIDENGRTVGRLTEVMETPASLVYVVNGETEHLIPNIPEFVMSTDAGTGIITVHLIEGM